MTVACSYVVAEADRELYSEQLREPPHEGARVEYDGCACEITTVISQYDPLLNAGQDQPKTFVARLARIAPADDADGNHDSGGGVASAGTDENP